MTYIVFYRTLILRSGAAMLQNKFLLLYGQSYGLGFYQLFLNKHWIFLIFVQTEKSSLKTP